MQCKSEWSPTAAKLAPLSLGAAAAISTGGLTSSPLAAKTADEFHSRGYSLRKKGNFEAAIVE